MRNPDYDWDNISSGSNNPFVVGTQLCGVADYFRLDSVILDIGALSERILYASSKIYLAQVRTKLG
jgi:hypothetical protein